MLSLTIICPLIGFLILAIFRDKLSQKIASIVGVGSMLLSMIAAFISIFGFMANPVPTAYKLWTWLAVGDFKADFGLYLDGLSVTMLGVITGVGFLIHLFASWYMDGEKHFSRFFSYLNLFVASMLMLVLADNLLLMYLGWEGVGICSYLLIGFYYNNRANGRAAMKAFTVTRVGDVFLAIGLFILFVVFGTLDMGVINSTVAQHFVANDTLLILAVMMLVGGAWGKSAQIPLHTWLADAMAGPTPVSALIHAATMVTAGVYLIARMHPLFVLTPNILLYWVGGVGAISMLVASFCAMAQTDIKRILAYSTMSQLGYMFIALGVGAWQVAIFHLMTHAFFKALLFLASGAVIISTHHEQDIFKMGGLYKKIPLVFVSFLVGGGALVALPLVTVGFYSKEAILWEAYATGHQWLFWAGVVGAFLTSVYTYRMIYWVFFGQEKTHAHKLSGISYALPLVVLIVLSTGLGALIHPPLADVLPLGVGEKLVETGQAHAKHTAEIIAVGAGLLGLGLGAILFSINKGKFVASFTANGLGGAIKYWCYHALGFDALYDIIFVKPFLLISRLLKSDPVDKLWQILPALTQFASRLFTKTQTGLLGHHAMSFGLGLVFILVLAMVMVV